jgi:single-strand DNA-binding protein
MTRGIETAFWGTLGKDPELKTSAKTGTAYTGMNVVVVTGRADDGKDVSQWLRVTCFGDTAKLIASRAAKGDRIYCEGTLTMNQWNDASGEVRHGLSVAAWKCERVASIGKSRERKPGSYQANDDAGSHQRQVSGQNHRNDHRDFDDPLPFGEQFR